MQHFIPHKHICEIKLFQPEAWKDSCPFGGDLSESQDECDDCIHFITVDFDPDNPLCIKEIIRN